MSWSNGSLRKLIPHWFSYRRKHYWPQWKQWTENFKESTKLNSIIHRDLYIHFTLTRIFYLCTVFLQKFTTLHHFVFFSQLKLSFPPLLSLQMTVLRSIYASSLGRLLTVPLWPACFLYVMWVSTSPKLLSSLAFSTHFNRLSDIKY